MLERHEEEEEWACENLYCGSEAEDTEGEEDDVEDDALSER